MRLKTLLAGSTGLKIKGDVDVDVTGITKDSRKVEEGYLFFITDKNKGYIEDAKRKGAIAIVSKTEVDITFRCSIISDDPEGLLGDMASRFFGNPSNRLHIIGITGTNGKTTTSYLIESILRQAKRAVGVIGTISHRYNTHKQKAENTTPGAEDIQRLLKDMADAKVEFVVMEASSHALKQKRVQGVDFDTTIFTNLTHDHLDYHGTIADYKKAKELLFKYYLKRSVKAERHAILNLDDKNASDFIPEGFAKTLFYSLKRGADASLIDLSEDIDGLKLEIDIMSRRLHVNTPLIGLFNASNILAASLFGYVAGLPLETIRDGIEALPGVPGRLERVRNKKGIHVFIDYAHTPDALQKVLEVLGRLKKGRLHLVFGCGGDRDNAKRPIMGKIAARLADFTIITSDNPRTEDPKRIIREIEGGFTGGLYKVIEDRREAILEGIRMSREGDVLLIAGKGHEDYQIIGDNVIPFSDREVAEGFLDVDSR